MTITINLPEDAQDDLETALEEGLAQVETGQGRPFEEFAEEFRARFETRYGATSRRAVQPSSKDGGQP